MKLNNTPVGLIPLLDCAYERLSAHDNFPQRAALDEFSASLTRSWHDLGADTWTDLVRACKEHPIWQVFHEDPFTRHAYEKPRGYAGDALLLDYVYGDCAAPETTSERGRFLLSYTTNTQASRSCVARKNVLGAWIDHVSAKGLDARILSVACGHLREVKDCSAFQAGKICGVTGVDQDPLSVSLANSMYEGSSVRAVVGSVASLLTTGHDLGTFDLVYAAGLYDYLEDRLATRLTSKLFEYLRSGGTLLLANYMPTIRDIGYMEAFMDWRLVYRSQDRIEKLGCRIPEALIGSTRFFTDQHDGVGFLEIERR